MAHSLRSKSKLRAKSIKRVKEFQKAVDERTLRLSAKMRENLIKQKQEKLQQLKENGEEVTEELVEDEDKMAVDAEEKKVNTSGYRTARHHLYKKGKKKKNPTIQFGKKK